MCDIQVLAAILVLIQHVGDVRGIAVDMHVLAANFFNELGSGPHADAPGVSRVFAADDLVRPASLVRDLPEVFLSPEQWRARLVNELRADSVRLVMIALVVTVAGTFTWADGQI